MTERKTITDFIPPKKRSDEKRPSLTVVAGRNPGRQYILVEGETLIGRDEECGIRLIDNRVSRKHARIVSDIGGELKPLFKLVDLDSTNGTFVNERRVKEAVLADGDKIHIGYTVFKYALRDIAEIEDEGKIYRMATTDTLTGLFSREHFLQLYSDLFRRSERYSRPFSFMMVDIDDFKFVNDTYGHPAGDHVLQCIGRIIASAIRYEDVAGRYGGEEFALLLPETSPKSACTPAERLRRNVEVEKFIAGPQNTSFSVTVSIGIAGYPDHADSMIALAEKADAALYAAKKAGKNQVHMFCPE